VTGHPPSDGELTRWLADVRSDHERLARRREQWLRRIDEENATFVGHLVDIADRQIDVVLETVARRITGRLRGVGIDVAVIADGSRSLVVPLASLHAVRTAEGTTTGDRTAPLDTTFGEALLELAAERVRVTVTLVSGDQIAGRLTAVGGDVATIATDAVGGDPSVAGHVAVRLTAINDVLVT